MLFSFVHTLSTYPYYQNIYRRYLNIYCDGTFFDRPSQGSQRPAEEARFRILRPPRFREASVSARITFSIELPRALCNFFSPRERNHRYGSATMTNRLHQAARGRETSALERLAHRGSNGARRSDIILANDMGPHTLCYELVTAADYFQQPERKAHRVEAMGPRDYASIGLPTSKETEMRRASRVDTEGSRGLRA